MRHTRKQVEISTLEVVMVVVVPDDDGCYLVLGSTGAPGAEEEISTLSSDMSVGRTADEAGIRATFALIGVIALALCAVLLVVGALLGRVGEAPLLAVLAALGTVTGLSAHHYFKVARRTDEQDGQ